MVQCSNRSYCKDKYAMWMINKNTPFAIERTWVRDKNGEEVWLVAIKGTFDIQPDESVVVAEEQEAVNIAPILRGGSETSSLLFDTDLPHRKNNTDVLVEGHAYAPHGLPTRNVKVALKVANVNKVLSVTGDRVWRKSLWGMAMTKPLPFLKMPLIYERAFGGTDQISTKPKHHGWESRNPIGYGFATKSEHLIGKPAPNIEDPTSLIRRWKHRPTPVGFGPIAGHWTPRVELAGTYDEKWKNNKQPLLPDDFDDTYYQCAPQDQQVRGFLKGGEVVELFNMTPSGHLKFRLPLLSFSIATHFFDGTSETHRAVLHTVTIKPDDPKVIVVWHTHLKCHFKGLKLSHTTIRIKK